MKKILILGAGIYQVPLIKKAKEMGLYTIVVSYKGNYPGFKLAHKVYYEDTTDYEKVLEICKNEGVDGIITTGTDVPVITVGKVCDELGLTGISYKAAEIATNKLLMKDKFIENGVRTAKHMKVYSYEDAINAYETLAKPVIFKAVDSSGSRGIVKVENKEQIKAAFDEVRDVTKLDYFIIEEFIEGVEFGAQAFVYNNELQFVLPHGDIVFQGKTGVPIGHYAPYEKISNELSKDINEQIKNSIVAMGLNNCALNIDFILKDGKVYVLEIGGRAGATCLVELVSIYYGYDYYEKLINCSLGLKETFDSNEANANASLLLMAEKNGVIKKITNNNLADENIIDISFDNEEGESVRKFAVGPDRIGQIIVKGSTLKEAMELLNRVKENIVIDIN